METFKNINVSVIGAVKSGIAAAKLLKSLGANVFVSDSANMQKLQESTKELDKNNIEYETGKHSDKIYNCSIMVISPGVPSNSPIVLEATKRNIKIVSELEVGSWNTCSPIIAITGSNGKTTTTTLTGEILKNANIKHIVAGNIGIAFSSVVNQLSINDYAVLEVSSFQLDHIEYFRPKISVLLNITPDHMDRYDHSMQKYADSKARVFLNQINNDIVIYNYDDEWTNKIISKAQCKKIPFSIKQKLEQGAFVQDNKLVISIDDVKSEIIETEKIFIKGKHNLYNSMAAAIVGKLIGIESSSIASTLQTFKGVEHRLEFVRELNGVKYYNDSKATNVDSVWYALQSFKEPIVILLGGRDKGNNYEPLIELVKKQVRAIVAIGESAKKVEDAFKNVVKVVTANSMEEAITKSKNLALSGDVVLLSPACASFDWFNNYEHRGKVFKELVNNL